MTDLSIHVSRRDASRVWLAALALLALTAVHHVYGAFVFSTPWRFHILAIVLPAALAIVLALRYRATASGYFAQRAATIVAALIIFLVPVALFGLYEGGYNHVLKNVIYFLHGEAEAVALFPPPLYEMPHNLFFEVTGIAQFPLSILTAVLTFRLLREPGR